MDHNHVRAVSDKLGDALDDEAVTQREGLLMIASENHVSRAVMDAQGSVLTNRNALGYPDDRLYPASWNIDRVEQLAIDHATDLWGVDHANVQPHSGSLANLAVLDPGDTLLALHPRDERPPARHAAAHQPWLRRGRPARGR